MPRLANSIIAGVIVGACLPFPVPFLFPRYFFSRLYLIAPRMSKAAWRVLLGLGEQPVCPAGDGIEPTSNPAVTSRSLVHDDPCRRCCCCCCSCLAEGDGTLVLPACPSPLLDPRRPGGEENAANSPETSSSPVPGPCLRHRSDDSSNLEGAPSYRVRYAAANARLPTGPSLGSPL